MSPDVRKYTFDAIEFTESISIPSSPKIAPNRQRGAAAARSGASPLQFSRFGILTVWRR